MAMTMTLFTWTLIEESRALTANINARIANYRKGPEIFRSLMENIDYLERHIVKVENILRKFPNAVPADVSAIFNDTISRVRNSLSNWNSTMERSFSKAFGTSGSSVRDRLKFAVYRTVRASELHSVMNDLETQMKEASNQLLQLTLALGNSLKVQEVIETLSMVEATEDVYHPQTSSHALPDAGNYEVDGNEDEVRSSTPSSASLESPDPVDRPLPSPDGRYETTHSTMLRLGRELALIAESRTLTESINTRIANYRKGPEIFRALIENVDYLERHLVEVENVLRKFPNAVPADVSAIFNDTICRVRNSLSNWNSTVERSFSKAFGTSGSSESDRLRSAVYRTVRASELHSVMNDLETQMKEASNQLLQLTLALGNALRMQEVIETLSMVEATEDVYHPQTSSHALPDAGNYEVDGNEDEVRSSTPSSASLESPDPVDRPLPSPDGRHETTHSTMLRLGPGLALIAESRTLTENINTRIANYRKGPEIFRALIENVDYLERHLVEVENVLRKFPNAVPADVSAIFNDTICRVRNSLSNWNSTVERSFSKAFGTSGSSESDRLRSAVYRIVRASELHSVMNDLDTQMKEASNQLLQLTLALGSSFKVQEVIETLSVIHTTVGVSDPRTNAPAISDAVHSISDRKDELERSPEPTWGPLRSPARSYETRRFIAQPLGLVPGIFSESFALANVINMWKARHRKGPEIFRALIENVKYLQRHLVEVENVLRKFPNAVPADVSDTFNETIFRVRNSLRNWNSTMERSFSKAFGTSGSSVRDRLRSAVYRTIRDSELHSVMNDLETQMKEASNQLLQLTLALGNALRTQEVIETLSMVEATDDVYRQATNSPALPHNVVLDFDGKDEEETPESSLKHSVLSKFSPHIIVGKPGVGKTIAIQGLAFDKDIQDRFPDGVLFVTLGQRATIRTVVRELKKIVTLTGGIAVGARLQSSTSVREAVDYAFTWFTGRRCLFVIDDLWPTNNCRTDFLDDLLQLLRACPESRMAVTTSNIVIAQHAESIVRFRARGPIVSEKIFMAHATAHLAEKPSVGPGTQLRDNISKILSVCDGLPIALSSKGRSVALLVRLCGTFDEACDVFSKKLDEKRSGYGDEHTAEDTSFIEESVLGLDFLEAEFKQLKTNSSLHVDQSISDLYTSLCVVEEETLIPVSVLKRLWQLDECAVASIVKLFSELGLGSRRSGSSEETGIILHNKQLDYCRKQAERMNRTSFWHAQLLNEYLKVPDGLLSIVPSAEMTRTIVNFAPRPWWSKDIPKDGFIHGNVARHLLNSGRGIELAALPLDVRWTMLRAQIDGMVALKSDFELLKTHFVQWESSREDGITVGEAKQGFNQIFKALQLSWGRMSEELRSFQFQVCGRLCSLRKSNAIIDTYLNSVEKNTPKPYLLPVSQFFPDLNSGIIMEIPVEGECRSISCSPCGRYIAAGAGPGIVVMETSTGEILTRLQGHTGVVREVTFDSESRRLISGSSDGTVTVWEWNQSNLTVQNLKGHDSDVMGVDVSAKGEERIFSSSNDGTLRIWDSKTGTETRKLPQSSLVNCVAVSADDRQLAIGLYDGTLRVLDSITRKVLHEDAEGSYGSVECVSFSAKGKYLAAGYLSTTVRVWRIQEWERINARLEGHEHWLTDIAFSPAETQIASCSLDGTVRAWNVESGQCVWVSLKMSSPVHSVSFTSNGKKLISGSRDGIVRIWDACFGTESKEQRFGRVEDVLGVAISGTGHQVASASTEGTVRLWNSHTGEPVGKDFQGHKGKVNCVSYSPSRPQLATGSDDKTIWLWDTESRTRIGDPFEGHTDCVSCVSFSHDGLRIVSGAWDKTVRLWNVETHEQVGGALQGHGTAVRSVSESTDGCHIVSRDYQLTIIWNRDTRATVWKSGKLESDWRNTIEDEEAEIIIRNCGQDAPHLWPSSFSAYTGELYWEEGGVYSNLHGNKTLLGNMNAVGDWTYQTEGKVFAAGVKTGAVVISRLIAE